MSRDLVVRNRRLAAEQERWPDGALDACERLDAEHPDWTVTWSAGNPYRGHERPAGYIATRDDDVHPARIEHPDAGRLAELIEQAPPMHTWRSPGCWCRWGVAEGAAHYGFVVDGKRVVRPGPEMLEG